ncbi:MAG: hypothetical protein WAM58_20045 [Candidatus Acidiferrum sp.]
MPSRSNIVYLSASFAGIAFLMLSCASSSHPDQLTVRIPEHFAGTSLHIDTCVTGAPAGEVKVDDRGLGKTPLCPASDHTVEIEVVGGGHYKLVAPEVQIRRTGDGIATSIEAQLPR